MKTPEDQEFERIEREQKRINEEQEKLREELAHASKAFDIAYDNLKRNEVIEEVAQNIEKFKGFGEDTIASFTVYIRNMKR
jgi:cytidylate kinase